MRRLWALVWGVGIGFGIVAIPASSSAQIETAWMNHYDGFGRGGTLPDAIVTDRAGNAYITGRTWNGSAFDQVLLKYDPNGMLLWERKYTGVAEFSGDATSLAISQSGNICITGSNSFGGRHHGYCVLTFDPSGGLMAEDWRNWPDFGPTHIQAVQSDAAGAVYVIGLHETSVGDTDCFVMKYSASGKLLWDNLFDATSSASMATALKVDTFGRIAVAGECRNHGVSQFLTIEYNQDGDLLWKERFHPEKDVRAVPRQIEIGGAGEVYVTGCSHGSRPDCDIVLVKYTGDGRRDWHRTYSATGHSPDRVAGMAVDASGNVFVAGFSRDAKTDFDYLTLKYDSYGGLVWETRYNGPSDSRDQARGVAIDPQGNALVTGASWLNGLGYRFVTVKYCADVPAGR